MSRKITAIILDWAGTTVDYGCFAPVNAFVKAFEAFGITPTIDETREPMGMEKLAHVAKMLEGERLSALWKEKHGKPHTKEDIDEIYSKFEPALFETLADYTDPIPGVIETVTKIREMGIVIGSTTGYTTKMMDVVIPLAKEKGYLPDFVVCPEDVGSGRPNPYMIWRNLEKLRISDVRQVVKIGDTAADMEEGKNAGCICVGIIKGSSMLGLSEKELTEKNQLEIVSLFEDTERKYFESGADFVIDDISKLPELIGKLNEGVQKND
jgi:phosphonoacetaldehyde hydrolase